MPHALDASRLEFQIENLSMPSSIPSPEVLDFLACERFAVAGVSSNESKYGTIVLRYLRNAGKAVDGINPRLDELDGRPVYPDLDRLPDPPQVLVLIVPAKIGLDLVEQAERLGIERIWLQPGAESASLLDRCGKLGLRTVHDRCIMAQNDRLSNERGPS